MIKKIHHVAVVVQDIEKSLLFWRDALGMTLSQVKNVPAQNARIAFLPAGESEVELVQPVGIDSGLARYLEKKGPGMHHICVQVDAIEPMLEQLKKLGVRLINENAMPGGDGKLYAFVHPESTGGVLVELYELPEN
ncbi:MAG: methylmalonyl-CoA epimerase [Chloroflexi bacterium GWB2_49_20]|nr:MAG: methylmalonyl-CoA epimerase [Chloroflexi bacterium GWB2_49_20]OGN77773.1 MAG: methylmalonyl-CoA epimerase [Chloroflexi bacterium GWC2_49_37]OGN86563.1 MAG: methylmalonyl-CoA epimerase [Chloroflexi bacterium GWD2_49_16]